MMRTREAGFTLIEIMVALLIMAGLSLIMAQSVKSGLDSRKKVQLQLSEESLIRDAMRLIVSDVGAAFHHRDYTVSVYNKVLELRKKKAAPAQAPVGQGTDGTGQGFSQSPGQVTSGAPVTPSAPDPLATATPLPVPTQLTAFVGSADAMTFTVRNHVRRFLDAKESDQARVSYFLRSCQGAKSKTSSSCLIRMEMTNPTDEFPLSPSDDQDVKGVVLVEHVTEFRLRYIMAEMEDFVDSWNSLATTGEQKDHFPDAVEITLSIQDRENPNSKPRLLSWLAPVRASNNQDKADKEAEEKAAASTTGNTGTNKPAVGNGKQQ